MDKHRLTVAIIAKNASSSIKAALTSVSWADDIVVLDDSSTDDTVKTAREFTRQVYITTQPNFAAKRNEALQKINTDWIFYVDSDEVVTKELASEIQTIITKNAIGAYRIKRQNYFLGTRMYSDFVDRLFHKSTLLKWQGDVHESPVITGSFQYLKHPIVHHTHTDITSMLEKTNQWSEFEADLRIKAHHPKVAWWRLIRIMLTEFWHQFGKLKVGRFGRSGVFEGYFQIVDKLIVYTKLWEKQQT